MKPVLALLGVCLLTGLLSSCSMVPANTEDLLEPPKLSPDQAALAEALERGLGTDDFTLKYPISGENRSAYILCNLDDESSNEAVVFYQLTGTDTIRMNILDQNDQGEWESVYDMAGAGDDIYTVDLATISTLDRNDLIISWKDRGRTELDIEIYSYEKGTLSNLFSGAGDRLYFMDINEDGYSEMVLLGWASSRDPSIQIVRRAGSRVIARDETILSSRAIDFTGLTLGKTLDGDTAIYVDELISSSSAATDIVVLDGFNMEVVTAAETGDDEEEEAADSLYDQTVRPSELTCQDYNGDGTIDIPISTLMPGYSSSDEDENIYRIDYQNLHDGELLPAYSVVSNREMGYIFLMPDNWVDNVTVRRVTETNEWQFVVYNGDLNSSGTVLLTLKVSSHQDYQDKFSTDVYFTLATKGIFEYTASIPTTDHELSITESEVRSRFLLS